MFTKQVMSIFVLPALTPFQPLAYALAFVLGVILTVQWMRRWFARTQPSFATKHAIATRTNPLPDAPQHLLTKPLDKPVAGDGLSPQGIKSILKAGGTSTRPVPNTPLPRVRSDVSFERVMRVDPDDIPQALFCSAGRYAAEHSMQRKKLKSIIKKYNENLPTSKEELTDFFLQQAPKLLHTIPVLDRSHNIQYACVDPNEGAKLCTERPVANNHTRGRFVPPSPLLPNLIPFILLQHALPCGVLFDLRNKRVYSYDPSHFYHDEHASSYFSQPAHSAIEQELRYIANDDSLRLTDFSHHELSPASPFQLHYATSYTYDFLIKSLACALGQEMESTDCILDDATFHDMIIKTWRNIQDSYPRRQRIEQLSNLASDGHTSPGDTPALHTQRKHVKFQLSTTP